MSISTKYKKLYVKSIQSLLQNYMPRGLILAIDAILVFIAVYITYFLVSSITNTIFEPFHIPWQYFLILGVQALLMIIFKSYSGIVRYSSLRDAAKQFQVVTVCMFSLLIINQVYFIIFDERFILNEILVIYAIITFPLLFIFRVLVKGTYEIIRRDTPTSRALILGVTHEDITMASGLTEQQGSNFSIVGFLDRQDKIKRKHIFGLPVYHIDQLSSNKKIADAVIINAEKLKNLQKSDTTILSQLLDKKLKIYKLPKLQDWMKSTESDFDRLKEIKIEDLLQRSPIKLNNKELSSLYRDKTVLVTGAAGSIGSEIVRQIIPFHPKRILLLDQAETPLHELSLELSNKNPKIQYEKIIANVRNRKRMQQVFELFHPEIVFHAAAYKHVPMMEANAIEAISVNFYGTHNIAELAVEYGAERFILISTDKAVNPTNVMGATKRSAELFIQYLSNKTNHKTTFVTTRFGNVLGSNGSVVPYFKKQIAAGGPITVTHPEITRYFMTIDEACQLVLEAGAMAHGGEIFVFDMGKPIKILDLAYQMIRLSGRIPEEDIQIEFTGLRPGEKLYEELLADEENTTKTHHEKIMIGNATSCFSDHELIGLCNQLRKITDTHDDIEAIKILKKLVPEYKQVNNIVL